MKCFKNNFFAAMLIAFTLVTFSSCHLNDDYVTRTELNCSFQSYTNSTGFFSSNGRDYIFGDLSGLGYNYGSIVGMDYNGTKFTVTGDLRYGDVIRDLYIDVDGIEPFLFSPRIDVLADREVMIFDTYNDPEFYNFMNKVMYRFYNQGRINILIDGYLTTKTGLPINNEKIELYLDNFLDVTTRK